MLPSDIMLRDDPHLRLHADEFLASESSFHESFAMTFKRASRNWASSSRLARRPDTGPSSALGRSSYEGGSGKGKSGCPFGH